jgi:hypothetical protein
MTIATGERLLASDINNLTFFPKGTILAFSSEAWNATSPEFKNIWKVCNGQNNTPNLVDKFLRGSAASGATGGANSQSIMLTINNLPTHSHSITDKTHTHGVSTAGAVDGSSGTHPQGNCFVYDSVSHSGWVSVPQIMGSSTGITGTNNAGDGTAFTVNTVPAYYSVIYIMKVV